MSLTRLLVASLLLSLLAAPALGRPPPGRTGHPPTRADPAVQDCAECHEATTPAVVKAWSASRHGEAMVKCLVCHGDTGKAFVRTPPSERCAACHATQVASLAGARPARSCFACHDPHALAPATAQANPHARR